MLIVVLILAVGLDEPRAAGGHLSFNAPTAAIAGRDVVM